MRMRRLDLVDDPEETGNRKDFQHILTIRSLYRNYCTRNPSKI